MSRLHRFWVLLLLPVLATGAEGWQPIDLALPEPSANAGKTGVYRARTSRSGSHYVVCVPDSYRPEQPAGLHVFIHGMGGQRMAGNFQLWAPFLQGANCIGINMEYTDGNPHDDAVGKMEAAREAVAQVAADYQVILGRGALTVFSAGGSPGGRWLGLYGSKARTHGLAWPFSQVNVFGAGLNCGEEITPLPLSWFRAMGEGEEGMAPGLLAYLHGKSAENLLDPQEHACRDVTFILTKGRGHTLPMDEITLAARQFARSSTMIAPFIPQPREVDARLQAVITDANLHRFARAQKGLERLKNAKAARTIGSLIKQQINAQVGACKELAASDPALAWYYAQLTLRQLDGHDAEDKAERALDQILENKQLRELNNSWAKGFGSIFEGRLAVGADAADFLRQIGEQAGGESSIGVMVERYLRFAR